MKVYHSRHSLKFFSIFCASMGRKSTFFPVLIHTSHLLWKTAKKILGFFIAFILEMHRSTSQTPRFPTHCWLHCWFARSSIFGAVIYSTARTRLLSPPSANRVASGQESKPNYSACNTSKSCGWDPSISHLRGVAEIGSCLDEPSLSCGYQKQSDSSLSGFTSQNHLRSTCAEGTRAKE